MIQQAGFESKFTRRRVPIASFFDAISIKAPLRPLRRFILLNKTVSPSLSPGEIAYSRERGSKFRDARLPRDEVLQGEGGLDRKRA